MILAASAGGLHWGDILFTLFSFLFIIAVIVGIVLLFSTSKKKGKRLERVEAKLDKLLAEKEK
ncbi:hypothetical protein GCM10011351_01120 [Paraliobacillus quinghaiensis]|uniref:DUF4083 domain-containing protein n=1 Tax=Paraliobacillus quinghaiensis TaxID=470815 RepID=A0A917WPD3_9BACI|nr:hypothetical protein [Paraliobacillus quinghaiensis]GGM19077.1 hypothetical protein GCM10011351_01120 [Paraliobacillus quinghaiensis]